MATIFPTGTQGAVYTTTFVQRYGGTPPCVWSVSAGALPTGLVLSVNGFVSGTVDLGAATGAWAFTITLRDALGRTSSKAFSITINAAAETPLPQLTWSSATLVNVAAEPSQPTRVLRTLQDDVQRSFAGTISFNPSLGAVDGGLDVGAEGASRWYYLYLVPSTGSDAVLAVRGSVTDPSTGPTGYANWAYIGAVRNDAGSNLIAFWHSRNRFDYQTFIQTAYDAAPVTGALVANDLSNYVPVTCAYARFHMTGTTTGNFGWVQFYVDGFASIYWAFKTGSGGQPVNDSYSPNYVPTPTIPKSITHQLLSDGGGCTFTLWYRMINGWLDGYLSSWRTP